MAENQSEVLRDALVLLHVFASSPWRSLETASGAMRLSISRMTAAEHAALRMNSRLTVSTIEEPKRLLTSPHVACLREIAAVGKTINVGEIYAKIQVLDEIIDLRTDRSFCVVSHESKIGELIEFGSPLIIAW